MSAKHTPGPWETLTFSNHELQTDFAMVKIGSRAHMVGCSGEDKANARLIATAPDLLAACWNVVLAADDTERVIAVEQARAAIAKATSHNTV